jgi:hypothetical protein
MNGSGSRLDRPSAHVLRLLPHVKPPPARLLLVGAGSDHEARALDARGYEVTLLDGEGVPEGLGLPVVAADFADTDFGGRFDLLCEIGAFGRMLRADWVAAAARALRPGGHAFGAFATDASALLHAVAPAFEVERCEPAAGGVLEVVLRRR